MDIDKVNDRMQEAWQIGDEALLHELAGDLVDEIRRLNAKVAQLGKVLEWFRLPEGEG